MSTWARIYAEIAASEDVANLRNQNPDAALLFVLGMPQAMPWGILPASPALFRAKVCPLFDLTLGQIEACLRLVIDSGLFTEYTDSRGKALVYYTAWNRYQGAQQWSRVGPPPFDLPPHWEPPENLPKALQQAARSNRGLTLEAIEARVLDSESKTSLRQAVNEPITSHRQGGEEVRSKKEEVRNGNDSAPPAADAPSEDPFAEDLTLSNPPAPKKQPKQDTPTQAAANACLALYGLTHRDMEDASKYFKAMGKLVADLTGGAEELQAWVAQEQANGQRKLGSGAKPENAIPARVRKEVTAATWQQTFAAAKQAQKTKGQRFIDHSVNGRIYECDWTEDMHGTVALYASQGLWDEERGMTTIDQRHPSRQAS